MTKLSKIQQELKAPKNQYNSFGKYKYRNCEDILEAVKPLLGDSILTISDEVVNIGDRYYIKATATFKNSEEEIKTTAFAREPLDRKGMDDSQITGATSSYARKYALNGLFCIDDTKDVDGLNNKDKKDDVKDDEKDVDKLNNKNKEDNTKDAEKMYVNLLNSKKIYSEKLHIDFNKMSKEEQRKEYKRVLDM